MIIVYVQGAMLLGTKSLSRGVDLCKMSVFKAWATVRAGSDAIPKRAEHF